jgi:hypothetical protein
MDNGLEQLNTARHPNAFLSKNPDLQELFCVFCGQDAAREAWETCGADICEYEDGYVLLFTDGRYISELDALFGRLHSHAGDQRPVHASRYGLGCAEKAGQRQSLRGLYADIYLHGMRTSVSGLSKSLQTIS